jgi:hypothetical protein
MKKIKDLFDKLNEVRRWRLCFYYNGILVKTKRVKKQELSSLKDTTYELTIRNKRQLFSAFKVNIIARPVVLLKTDEKKKKVYIGVVIEQGTNL